MRWRRASCRSPGPLAQRVDLTDDMTSFRLPPGGVAQVAVYSDHWQPVAVLGRNLLRMKSWMNYVIYDRPPFLQLWPDQPGERQ